MKKSIFVSSVSETEKVGQKMGSLLRGGECIEFVSDLGGGKTTFVKSLVDGAGSLDNVSSPTFTISKQYDAGNLHFYHFDFYRLQVPGLIVEELKESLQGKNNIVLIEWGQTVSKVLPKNRVVVQISKSTNELESRHFTFTIPENLSYLMGIF